MPPLAPRRRKIRDRRADDRPATPILVVGSSIAGSVLTLTFDGPVSLGGVPAFTTDFPTHVAVSATRVAANAVAITYNEPLAGIVALNVGFRDPAIRNASGGYVTSNTVVL